MNVRNCLVPKNSPCAVLQQLCMDQRIAWCHQSAVCNNLCLIIIVGQPFNQKEVTEEKDMRAWIRWTCSVLYPSYHTVS
jgi:hypothetical protein